ncbi:MAG: hypothetical protein A3B25_00710 [Candidatus Ryanbacteria bacterium RIFCSPLOWO2_01_FULL_48_26]|uniref:Uncharacterized protein n=1 Tax=Candidatus Ryanbacteria bacterium RIFCSPLOWO2_01_FULL_48_26 TaxID=1802126 RepID=A0A1G2GW53_9BACT|nr:MAG: hypothetical protein A3B25_00710 [Candidatus Ryanbacteria bacterium RIFCSPLOWO2_01_FULL_48_26]
MIPKPIEKLAREISRESARRQQEKVPNPEEWLVVLLSNIKKDMTENNRGSAMLARVVDWATFEDELQEARKLLKRSKRRKLNSVRKNS